MKEQLLVTEKMVKENRFLKKNQIRSLRRNRKVKGTNIKTKIGKIVALTSDDSYLDLVGDTDKERSEQIICMPQNINEFLECLERNQVCGLGGSCFPTAEKINSVILSRAPSRFLVINAVTCDPGLLHDDWLLKYKIEQIEKGIEILQKYITFEETIIASKQTADKYTQNASYTIERVPDRYPMGAERLLIQQILGRTIPEDKTPSKQGILVLNLQTVYAIYEAVYHNQVLNSRFLTVADLESGEAVVVRAAIGSKVSEIATKVWDGFRSKGKAYLESHALYYGSGFMRAKDANETDTVLSSTGLIAVGTAVQFRDEAKCKKCRACRKNCPMGVNVYKAVKAIQKGNFEKARRYGTDRCIQCGACSYFCHAGKHIMRIIARVKLPQE